MDDKGWTQHISPVRSAGAAEAIARRLGELIGARILVGGDRLLPEKGLAELFGVAVMTIRHSMAVLREDGLIETRRGHGAGTYVVPDVLSRIGELTALHPYTLAGIEELTAWRIAVSGEASARAARRASEAGLARLRELESAADAAVADPEAYRTADAGLHLHIAELSGSRRLLEAEQGIQHELTRLLAGHPGGPEARSMPDQRHRALAAAIEARDPARAREQFTVHAEATADLCLPFVQQPSGPALPVMPPERTRSTTARR
ncbi:FCD domain-containing protein [Kitasatospora sp. NPDC093102]|uniref:FadR/GntR family transcriptional regulator n=1 Tax=Kitasatospora sp. NPDC093102 TaxID=3155069 RepID=UPI00341561B4